MMQETTSWFILFCEFSNPSPRKTLVHSVDKCMVPYRQSFSPVFCPDFFPVFSRGSSRQFSLKSSRQFSLKSSRQFSSRQSSFEVSLQCVLWLMRPEDRKENMFVVPHVSSLTRLHFQAFHPNLSPPVSQICGPSFSQALTLHASSFLLHAGSSSAIVTSVLSTWYMGHHMSFQSATRIEGSVAYITGIRFSPLSVQG